MNKYVLIKNPKKFRIVVSREVNQIEAWYTKINYLKPEQQDSKFEKVWCSLCYSLYSSLYLKCNIKHYRTRKIAQWTKDLLRQVQGLGFNPYHHMPGQTWTFRNI